MYSIGVIGWGVVGKGIGRLFAEELTAVFDVNNPMLPNVGMSKLDFKTVDLAAVCVPTPSAKDGSCETSAIETTLDWLADLPFKGIVLIKSAVPPTEIKRFVRKYHLRIVVSPEYMGESKYFTPAWKYPDPVNMASHTWQVFGGEKKDTSECVDIFKRRMGVDTVFIQTNHITAALCKYMENSFFATKVTFCNEWFDIASAYGVDYNELRECWLADPRINRNHTLVFPKDRGYGGKCFPKDVKAIIKDAVKVGYQAELMEAVDKTNTQFRQYNELL